MKHADALDKLKQAQDAEYDMRENSKECALFVEKRDGQWEPDVVEKLKGKPRYTDDRVGPVINQVGGEMSDAEFTIRVNPAGGTATKDVARVFDGLVRTIRNQSGAEMIFKKAAKQMLKTGISGWYIDQDYSDADTFDQDLIIKPIHNYEQRVWIDPYSLEADNADAKWGVILEYVSREEYETRFKDGKMLSIGNANDDETYAHKPDFITIGRMFYKKAVKREIVEMNNGAVYDVNDEFEMLVDELAMSGIVETRRRKRDSWKLYARLFDGGGWLTPEEETVFNKLPIITVYGNYAVSEGKRLYYGIPEKLLDIQRVHNYAFSREIEEVALSPRAKFWMTRDQVSKNKQDIEDLQTLNTNMKPVQFYTNDPSIPGPPQQNGGGQVNPALRTLVSETGFGINHAAGIFSANLGENPGLQSGVAIGKQIDQGNNGTRGYFDAMEVAIAYTGKVLIDAIPKVYDSTRQVRIIQEDGSQETVMLNEQILDQQTGQTMALNDLSQGNYDVVCEMGAAYSSKMQEAVDMFIRASERDPMAMEMGRDILYKNIDAPGFTDLAERARMSMVEQGLLPMEQLTEEERAREEQAAAEAANQPEQADPNMIAMQIEEMKAQTAMLAEQNQMQLNEIKTQELQIKFSGQQEKLQSDLQVKAAQIEQAQQKIDQDTAKMQMQAQNNEMNLMLRVQDLEIKQLKNQNDFGLKLTEMEMQAGQQLDQEVASNTLIYDPETGNFVR